ncbi:hypothetical protein MMC13_005948 [Lambiella insularis]|nr:hypothetical protein [Lambiella insularis]
MTIAKTSSGLEYYKVDKDYYNGDWVENVDLFDWTNDPEQFEGFPFTNDNELEEYNFPPGKLLPILVAPDSGRYLFQAGNDFYFWWVIAGTLERIEAPKDIAEILKLLKSEKGCRVKSLLINGRKVQDPR